MKHTFDPRRGQTLVEALVGFAIFGIVIALGSAAYVEFDKRNAGIGRLIEESNRVHNIHLLLSHPKIVKDLFWKNNASLEDCFLKGRCSANPVSLTVDPTVDWAFKDLPLNFRLLGIRSGIVMIEVDFTDNPRPPLMVYLNRQAFLGGMAPLVKLSCGKGTFIYGVDFQDASALCGSPTKASVK